MLLINMHCVVIIENIMNNPPESVDILYVINYDCLFSCCEWELSASVP